MFDIIGDIHGHADELEQLLLMMGYELKSGSYQHPERKALFVGDYIDRGPKIRETLQMIRSMVEKGNAITLMGNHKYNALCFHYPEIEGGHVRKHLIKNIIQHIETLKQFQNLQSEYEDYLDWFKTLPLYFENANFRAVHACWDAQAIDLLRKTLVNGCLNDKLIYASAVKESALHKAVEIALKGKEMKIPEGLSFKDKDGTERSRFRIKWWENPLEMNYRTISVEAINSLPEKPIDMAALSTKNYYSAQDKPVFFGHYWLKGKPMLQKSNVCCLDYSVAKAGKLVAYRFQGEFILREENFVYA
jgi:hypothetical protein